LVKNSDTEISRCRAPISTAVTVDPGFFTGGAGAGVASGVGGAAFAVTSFGFAALGVAAFVTLGVAAFVALGVAAFAACFAPRAFLRATGFVFFAIGPIEAKSDAETKSER
jgi:hypothetical protein